VVSGRSSRSGRLPETTPQWMELPGFMGA
jgi:hypothetical protein